MLKYIYLLFLLAIFTFCNSCSYEKSVIDNENEADNNLDISLGSNNQTDKDILNFSEPNIINEIDEEIKTSNSEGNENQIENNNLIISNDSNDETEDLNNNYTEYSVSIENYIKGEVSFEDVLISRRIPDFIKNIFFEEAFTFLATTRVDDTFGYYALEKYNIIQPSRLSISSSLLIMFEQHHLSRKEIENNIYKNVVFPDLLISPKLMTNKSPIEIAKILNTLYKILNNKSIETPYQRNLDDYNKKYKTYMDSRLTIDKVKYLNIDKNILFEIIKSILVNIEFFTTYTNYNFYKILHHPYFSSIVSEALTEIIEEDSLQLNTMLFLNLKLETLLQDRKLKDAIIYEINKGMLYKNIIKSNAAPTSKFMKSLILLTIFYNYIHNQGMELHNLVNIYSVLENMNSKSSTLKEIIDLSLEILNSSFPKSYVTSDKLIRTYHKYHLSSGISGLSYGSVSWDFNIIDGLNLYLISGDYKIYEMNMETRMLIVLEDIYDMALEEDLFLPIFEFDYSNDYNVALINFSRPTYINSYIFDFKRSRFVELNKLFNKKVFTSYGYMLPSKRGLIVESLNSDNEKDNLIHVNLGDYSIQALLSDIKIDILEVSPTGTRLLITGNLYPNEDDSLSKPYIYDLLTERIKPIPIEAEWTAFSWDIKEELIYYSVENNDVYVYSILSNKSKKIIHNDLFIYALATGKKMIAFSYLYEDTGENRLYLYNTKTLKSTLIDIVYDGVIRPGFSPDGQYLFYEIVRDEYKDLYLLKVKN